MLLFLRVRLLGVMLQIIKVAVPLGYSDIRYYQKSE